MKKDQNDLPIEVDLIARKTPQLIVFLVTGLILSTCLASVQNEDTNDPTGTYILAAVDGEELPATVTHGNVEIEVHSGTFLISADGTCSSKVIFGPPSGAGFAREVKATYTREGSKLKMKGTQSRGHTFWLPSTCTGSVILYSGRSQASNGQLKLDLGREFPA